LFDRIYAIDGNKLIAFNFIHILFLYQTIRIVASRYATPVGLLQQIAQFVVMAFKITQISDE
jgi:hypothetical protein